MDKLFGLFLFIYVIVFLNLFLGIICFDIILDKVSLILGIGLWLMLSK